MVIIERQQPVVDVEVGDWEGPGAICPNLWFGQPLAQSVYTAFVQATAFWALMTLTGDPYGLKTVYSYLWGTGSLCLLLIGRKYFFLNLACVSLHFIHKHTCIQSKLELHNC